ncbi:hypothetical protein BJ508DRAFT_316366, partial [Ascobolus immersus RN42]
MQEYTVIKSISDEDEVPGYILRQSTSELVLYSHLCGTDESTYTMNPDSDIANVHPSELTWAEVPPFPSIPLLCQYLGNDHHAQIVYRRMLEYNAVFVRSETTMDWQWTEAAPYGIMSVPESMSSWPVDLDIAADVKFVARVTGEEPYVSWDATRGSCLFLSVKQLADMLVPLDYRRYNYNPELHGISRAVWIMERNSFVESLEENGMELINPQPEEFDCSDPELQAAAASLSANTGSLPEPVNDPYPLTEHGELQFDLVD